MNCFIIAAISADGYIARSDDQSSMTWTSKEDKKRFVELTKRAGVIVMGKNTWKTIGKTLKDRLNIVYTRGTLEIPTEKGKLETTAKSPVELLQELESRGFKEVAICGGAQIYSMFIKAGVVNRFYLTIEPIIFGSGVRLTNESFEMPLKLVNIEKKESGTVFLEYEK